MPNSNYSRIIIVVGLKHSGKSTIAKAFMNDAHFRVFDLDTHLLKEAQQDDCSVRSVRDLYRAMGKRRFQMFEARAFRAIVASFEKSDKSYLISCGGASGENRAIRRVINRGAPPFYFLILLFRRLLTPFFQMDAETPDSDPVHVLYLKSDPSQLYERITKSGLPPFLEHKKDPQRSWKRLAQKRAKYLQNIADSTLESSALLPILNDMNALKTIVLKNVGILRNGGK